MAIAENKSSPKTQQSIDSYEYKVMLKPNNFNGSPQKVIKKAKEFWLAFETLIKDMVVETKGSLDEKEENRAIRFYDTDDHLLYNSSYIFRERVDMVDESEIEDTATKEATLKFRHPDYYIAQDRYMSAATAEKDKTKFEEDITLKKEGNKVSIISFYSFSTTQPISENLTFAKLDDIAPLYTDLKNQFTANQGDLSLHIVGNFTAREIVLEGAKFKVVEGNTKVEAKCALILWYDSKINNTPKFVEFSFKYKNNQGKNNKEISQVITKIFAQLESLKDTWTDIGGLTKTAYVYSLDS